MIVVVDCCEMLMIADDGCCELMMMMKKIENLTWMDAALYACGEHRMASWFGVAEVASYLLSDHLVSDRE